MKNLNTYIIIFLLSVAAWHPVKGQSSLGLVESDGSCGLITDCAQNVLCFDIVLTPGIDADVLSYNIWVKYTGAGLSYLSDTTCITEVGQDNNLDIFGLYRVSGALGEDMVQMDVPVSIHTICFTYSSEDDILNQEISVGGTVFDVLHSPLSYNNPANNEPMLPDFPFQITEGEISCLILPVNWLSFEVQKQGEASALNWVTAQEINNAGYDVERSADGRHFESIGYVKADDRSGDIKGYSYIDPKPFAGLNYYRIRQVDHDGGYGYSPVRTLRFTGNALTLKVWPNPSAENVFVEIPGGLEEGGEIRIVNVDGMIVWSQTYLTFGPQTEIETRTIPPGNYNILIESAGNIYQDKLIILK